MADTALDELDNLIAGFLDGDLTEEQGETLAKRIESDPVAARAFDEALRTEALLRAAHHGEAGASAVNSPAIIRAHFGSSRAWIAVAAMLALMFGAAIYYKWIAPEKENLAVIDNKSGKTQQACTVASGRVWVDGREAKTIAENEWLNVAPEGPAKLKCSDRVEINLDGGSGALLRKNGATLLNGSGIFKINPGAEIFTLETASGTVFMSNGEFSARLDSESSTKKIGEPQMKRSVAVTLAVTVFAGSAQIGYNGKFALMSVGESRVYGGEGVLPERPRQGDGPVQSPRSPEFGLIGMILDHAKELNLTDEQAKQIEEHKKEITANRAKMDGDPVIKELRRQLRAAYENGKQEEARTIRDSLNAREDEVRKDLKAITNPHDILNDDQNRMLHELMEQSRPNRRPGDDGAPPPPRDGPPEDRRPPGQQVGPLNGGERRRPPQGQGDRLPPPPIGDGPAPGVPPDGPPDKAQNPDRQNLPPRLDAAGLRMLMDHADELKLTDEQKQKLRELLDKRPREDGGDERRGNRPPNAGQ